MSYDPSKLQIIRKRFSQTQGECELIYDGQRIEQYGDTYTLQNGEWQGHPDEYWHEVARCVLAPTMTDMMVDPDTLGAFMEANPLPKDNPMPNTVNETAERIVRQEVLVCLSHMVGTLANNVYAFPRERGADLYDLQEQAMELASPLLDYEEAAIQAGWDIEDNAFVNRDGSTADASPENACGWEDLCRECDIEPYEREVYEFWAVSSWFADKLIEQGEQVDKDFANLCVWARTTTGQGIAQDSVVQTIAASIVSDK